MTEFDFLSHTKISDRLYLVRENFLARMGFNIGVILGDDKTMVIDSGMGVTHGLRRYIETYITDKKPMVCYMTHGHIDHASGSPLFDEIHINARDWPNRYWNEFNIDRRFSDLYEFCGGNEEVMAFCRDKYVEPNLGPVLDVEDGDIIDLGGVKIEVYAIPGHSAGSVAYYNREENYAFVGDQISTHVVGCAGCNTLPYSIEKLKDFIAAMPEDVRLYHGHGPQPMGLDAARNVLVAFEDIEAGRTWDDEYAPKMKHAMNNPVDAALVRRTHVVNGVGIGYAETYYPSAKR